MASNPVDVVKSKIRAGTNSGSGTPIGTPRGVPNSIARSNSQGFNQSPRTSSSAVSRAESASGGANVGRPSFSESVMSQTIDIENPDPAVVRVVGRHLNKDHDELQQPAGDITRDIYNWQREHERGEASIKRGRSRSIDVPHHQPPQEARAMLTPGGFRREFVSHRDSNVSSAGAENPISDPESLTSAAPAYTRNFIEFLSLYGHFAGEELEEEYDEEEDVSGEGEETPLVHPRPRLLHRASANSAGTASTLETIMLLLKSFVGTGVLFLPKAFSNGGLLFSSCVLTLVSIVSYWCFLLLIDAKNHTKVASFGDIGGALFGDGVRKIILGSIVISQIGFASAYIVFVGENLQSFLHNISESEPVWTISSLIIVQLLVFTPLSMIRDIAKLGFTAIVADAFILAGLLYLYGWGSMELLTRGVKDVTMFNSQSWTLFIGTAVFTFEGIGLIIPIQESMRQPDKFGSVLGGVMVGITLLFVSAGALLYAAAGSKVQTVILLNLPQNVWVNGIQLLYSLAILLSTPLQLFPAIRILEQALFVRSGKFNRRVKWEKNLFRFGLVISTGIVAWLGADDLDKFVALIGSTACVPLVYIYPPLLHVRIVPYGSWRYILDWMLIVFGTVMMLYTSITTIMAWVG